MKIKFSKIFKIIAIALYFFMVFEQSGFAQIAGELDISGQIAAFRNSFVQDKFRPLHLRYLQYDPQLNNFKLLLDKGNLKSLSNSFVEESTKTLLQYFLVGVSLPNDAFWVNLRPDSPDNVIDPLLGQTDVGKILLEADVQLKKDTARFTSPETPEGKEYWDKLYVKAGEIFGSQNVIIPTLTRPWIVPNEIILRETSDNAYIYKATLKVMLEDDYLKGSAVYNFKDERLKELNAYASSVLREKIIPKLTQEVNASKKYAALRQVYYSLILAQWFKQRYNVIPARAGVIPAKAGIQNPYTSLINRKNLTGLISKDSWSKNTYFQQYQKSFQDGEYNFKVPMTTPYGQVIRSYFSGGVDLMDTAPATRVGLALEGLKQLPSTIMDSARNVLVRFNTGKVEVDKAGLNSVETQPPVAASVTPATPPVAETPTEEPAKEEYYAVHALDFDPRLNGNIRHARINSGSEDVVYLTAQIGGEEARIVIPRNTVHFSINHIVEPVNGIHAWDNKGWIIVVPLADLIKANLGGLIGGVSQDTFFWGDVILPKSAQVFNSHKAANDHLLKLKKEKTMKPLIQTDSDFKYQDFLESEGLFRGLHINHWTAWLQENYIYWVWAAHCLRSADFNYYAVEEGYRSAFLEGARAGIIPRNLSELREWLNSNLEEFQKTLPFPERSRAKELLEKTNALDKDFAEQQEAENTPPDNILPAAAPVTAQEAETLEVGENKIPIQWEDLVPEIISKKIDNLRGKIKKVLSNEEFIKETMKNIYNIDNFLIEKVKHISIKRIGYGIHNQVFVVTMTNDDQSEINFILKPAHNEGAGDDFMRRLRILQELNKDKDTSKLVPILGSFDKDSEIWSEEYVNTTGKDLSQWQAELSENKEKLEAMEEAALRAYYLLYKNQGGCLEDPAPRNFVVTEDISTGNFKVKIVDVGTYHKIAPEDFLKEWIEPLIYTTVNDKLRIAGDFDAKMVFTAILKEGGREDLVKLQESLPEDLRSTLDELLKETENKDDEGASTIQPFAAQGDRNVDPSPSGLRMTDDLLSSGSTPETGKGGIDFRAMPTVIQPAVKLGDGSLLRNVSLSPEILQSASGLPQDDGIELDKEWQDIERVVNADIIPSIERIKEYLILSCKSADCQEKINQALSGIADILRLEEERSAPTETGLKEILTLLESNKSAEQLSAALRKIVIASQEPVRI